MYNREKKTGRSLKRAISIVCVLVLMMSCMVFADAESTPNFVDVEDSYWAKDNIKFAAEKKIVNGYYDEYAGVYTFRPENNVSYEEAVTMLWRALEAAGKNEKTYTEEEKEILIQTYKADLDANNIAAWASFYVADFLNRGIVEKEQLSSFVGEANIGNSAPRMTVAKWTAKAIERDFAAVYYLPYADASSISVADRPYVDMLYRHGIMRGSKELDGSITFLPNNGVKRSEFAAIANRVYENINKGYVLENEIYTYKSIDNLYAASDFLQIKDGGNRIELAIGGSGNILDYVSPSKPFVLVGITGTKLVATATKDAQGLPQLHRMTEPEKVEGELITIEEVTSIAGETLAKIEVSVADNNIFYVMDSKTKEYDKIQRGDEVELIADGIKVVEIRVK